MTPTRSSSCVSLVTRALGLIRQGKIYYPCTLLVSNVADITRTDMRASSAGTLVVFSLFEPSFLVLPVDLSIFQSVRKIRTY
jgi:hypothetical protein